MTRIVTVAIQAIAPAAHAARHKTASTTEMGSWSIQKLKALIARIRAKKPCTRYITFRHSHRSILRAPMTLARTRAHLAVAV